MACPKGGADGTCAAGVGVAAGTMIVNFTSSTNIVQNGLTDAVALVDVAAGTVVDALSYEGAISAGVITGVGTFDLVEGTSITVADDGAFTDALVRRPNGSDTGDAATDWARRPPSPGAANP